MPANFDAIIMFPIYGQFEATRKLNLGGMAFKARHFH